MIRRGGTLRNVLLPALLVLVGGLAGEATAQQDGLTVRAFLSPATGHRDGEALRLVLHVEGAVAGTPQVRPVQLPEMTNLTLVSPNPATKTNIAWVNGRTSASVELTYTLFPDGPGPAVVPAFEVQVDGQTYKTSELRTEIDTSSTPPRPGERTRSGPRDASAAGLIYLEARLGAEEVWEGQPVSLEVLLLSQPRVSSFNWRQQPEFGSLWVESFDFDPDAEATRRRIGDNTYLVYPVDRRMLIPPAPGTYEIGPYIAEVQVRLSRNDPFDWFRFGRSEMALRRTNPMTLRVKPLPSRDRPSTFDGAVGVYQLEAQLDRQEARIDDAVALQATVRGEGALRSVAPPRLEELADFKLFDPQVKESTVSTIDGKITSAKTWEWILVPLTPGAIELPALRFDFFNPRTARYEAATAGGLQLVVGRGSDPADSSLARGDIQVQRRELAFIKLARTPLREAHPRAHERPLFRALLALPLVLTPLLILVGRRRARLSRDHGLARSRRARARARKRLQQLGRRIEQDDSAAFHEEVARTLVTYLADRTNRSASGLTYDAADAMLAAAGVDGDLRRRFRTCLETCDFVRFVPAATKSERRREVLDEATALVEALEPEL